jgi:hypothetical protein
VHDCNTIKRHKNGGTNKLQPVTTPIRTLDLNEDKERSAILAVTVFRNEQRMVTASRDMTLRLWELTLTTLKDEDNERALQMGT